MVRVAVNETTLGERALYEYGSREINSSERAFPKSYALESTSREIATQKGFATKCLASQLVVIERNIFEFAFVRIRCFG